MRSADEGVGAGTEASGVDKDWGDALFCSETSPQKKKAIIADLLHRDVRYQPQWRRRLFVFGGLCGEVCSGRARIFLPKTGVAHRFSLCVCLRPLQLFIFCIVYPAAGAVNIPLVPPRLQHSGSSTADAAASFLLLSFFFFFVFPEIVDMAINKEQPRGAEINSATLGL